MKNDRKITISVAGNRKSVNWKPQTLRLSEFYDRLKTPVRSTETMAEYLSMTKGQRDELKDVGGFVGGTLSGTRRKANAVTGRDLLTLDLDNIPGHGTDDVVRRVVALACGYCIYSTRKHTPSAPRLRILLPLDRTATADEYEPCARYIADKLGMALADPTTFESRGYQPRKTGGQAGRPDRKNGRGGCILPLLRHCSRHGQVLARSVCASGHSGEPVHLPGRLHHRRRCPLR